MNAVGVAGSSSASSSYSSSSSSSTTVLRQVVSEPAPFIWSGLLPLLGLLLLLLWAWFAFARNDVEAHVREHIQADLTAKNMGWVKMNVSGQHVVLSGTPPDGSAGDSALDLARASQCPTWSGHRTCAVQVTAAFDAPAPPMPPVVAPVAASPKPAEPAPAPAPAARAAACEKQLADELAGQHIEFASGSAVIAARSGPLLDRLATAAKACPGKLMVEGHTDNVGSAASNQRLSQARAEAVRYALVKRGLPAERLTARGFGENKPLADNGSNEGRAKNRRIEFKAGS